MAPHKRTLARLLGTASLLASVAVSPASADIPDALSAQGGGAPPGYDTEHYQDPDYQPDQALVSYNDPFAGQSDDALKAKIGDLDQQSVFDDATGYNPDRGKGTEVENLLQQIYALSQQDVGDGTGVTGVKSTEWQDAIDSRDSFGGPANDAISGDINWGSEEFIGDAFFHTVDKQRWDSFVDETRNRRERLNGEIETELRQIRDNLIATANGNNPQFDADAYEALDNKLEQIRGDYARQRNILREELQAANAKFLSSALSAEASINEADKEFWRQSIILTVIGGTGFAGGAVLRTTALKRWGDFTAAIVRTPGFATNPAYVALENTFSGMFGVGTLGNVANISLDGFLMQPTVNRFRRRMNLMNAPIDAVKGEYESSLNDIQRLDRLRDGLGNVRDINQSLYQRQTGLQCSSPCTLEALGLGISDYVSRSAYYFAGRSPEGAAIYNAFGPPSQFDQRWIYEQSNGTMSPFDNRWINERSQGPISQFDHSWMYEDGINPDSVQSWTQKFPSTNGLPGANPDDVFGGLSQSIVADLQGLDARLLLDDDMRAQLAEQISARLVREFDIDPAVGEAVANGTLIGLTQQIQQMPGLLTGGGSTGGFTDITLELPLLFEVFDFATVDGDIITLRVVDQNGLQLGPINVTLSGPATADRFAPNVQAGPIEISVTAVNTGDFPPNTGEVNILSNITAGEKQQRFSLTTGETGILSITATPPP